MIIKLNKLIIPLLIELITWVSGTLYTLNGNKIPDSLMSYLNCSVDDILCKHEKNNQCQLWYSICKECSFDSLSKNLLNHGYILENISPDAFCRVHQEVCDMIIDYDPSFIDEYNHDYDKYNNCKFGDTTCISNQESRCKSALTKCWSTYPKDDCKKLSEICSNIKNQVNDSNFLKMLTSLKSKSRKIKNRISKNRLSKRKKLRLINEQKERMKFPLRKKQKRSRNQLNKYMRKNYIPAGKIIEDYIINLLPERIRNLLPKKLPVKKSVGDFFFYRRLFRYLF